MKAGKKWRLLILEGKGFVNFLISIFRNLDMLCTFST